jgi:hypothetical protein
MLILFELGMIHTGGEETTWEKGQLSVFLRAHVREIFVRERKRNNV